MDRVIRRLGILGGTFDPIHHAHLVAAGEARSQLELDCVLFVPAGDPPHKPLRPVSPAAHRLRMLELAIGHKSEFAVSLVDLDRSGPSYTADALRLLRAEWGPEPEFFFIEGSDSLAEIELSVLNRQCLDRYIPDIATLAQETAAWATKRNSKGATVNWRFTTMDARIKLKRLYPSIDD
jgi:cytidyltransferase-like protein